MIKIKNIFTFGNLLLPLLCLQSKTVHFQNNKYFVYQSKYYKPQVSVQQLLNQNSIDFRLNDNVFRLKYCPFCKKHHNNDPTNHYTLNVNKQNGLYYCHRCRAGGSYFDLKKALLGINVDPIYDPIPISTTSSQDLRQIPQQLISQTEYFIYKENFKKQEFKDVRMYLHERGFTDSTIEKYSIGCGYQLFMNEEDDSISVKVLYFPMQKFLSKQEQKKRLLSSANEDAKDDVSITQLAKLKMRGVGKENKKYMRQMPAGPARGLFGLNTIKKSDKVVCLTEGQFDAMSVYQSTGIPSLSLPQGANSLPDAILPYLDQFEKVILWMDNDEAGRLNIDKFAAKLGVSRTHIVINNQKQFKDANDFLQKKPEKINQLINKARTLPDQNIVQFDLLRDQIKERLLNQKQFEGVQLSDFSFFNKKVKGIRQCEVSVISGGTGSGKTTLLSQISIDLSKRKIAVLWGSFQIRNQILISNMITQYSDLNLKQNKHVFDAVADRFTELPLYYMSFHGSNDINKVLGTITYAIQRYGINFVVIDTLQFLLSGQGEGYKKFDMQDYVMAELRKIATAYKVHIAIVIHPRKTQDNEDIGIHSIYGTSKATQEADNIWVIQNRDGYKIFDVKKNRYDGDVGRAAMGFNKNNKSFFQLRKKELENLFNKQKTISQILQDRQAQKDDNQVVQQQQPNWLNLDDTSQGDEPQLQRMTRRKY